MKFHPPLVHGKLIKRYKRFLSDIQLDDNSIKLAHCTNSGSMKSCIEEGAEVYLSKSTNPNRKTPYTWEMIFINNGWVGVNTSNPNKLAFKYIKEDKVPGLSGYNIIKREVKIHDSRLDIYLENETEKCFVEVKNVTYKESDYALFPDAKTERGLKHLNTLIRLKSENYRAVMLYIVQRTDVIKFAAAKEIDPIYAQKLKEAYQSGVEIIVLQVKVSPEEIVPHKTIPFIV